jgi:hypothetical protein
MLVLLWDPLGNGCEKNQALLMVIIVIIANGKATQFENLLLNQPRRPRRFCPKNPGECREEWLGYRNYDYLLLIITAI